MLNEADTLSPTLQRSGAEGTTVHDAAAAIIQEFKFLALARAQERECDPMQLEIEARRPSNK